MVPTGFQVFMVGCVRSNEYMVTLAMYGMDRLVCGVRCTAVVIEAWSAYRVRCSVPIIATHQARTFLIPHPDNLVLYTDDDDDQGTIRDRAQGSLRWPSWCTPPHPRGGIKKVADQSNNRRDSLNKTGGGA